MIIASGLDKYLKRVCVNCQMNGIHVIAILAFLAEGLIQPLRGINDDGVGARTISTMEDCVEHNGNATFQKNLRPPVYVKIGLTVDVSYTSAPIANQYFFEYSPLPLWRECINSITRNFK